MIFPARNLHFMVGIFHGYVSHNQFAMENCPFIHGLPIKNGDFPMAMLVITRWSLFDPAMRCGEDGGQVDAFRHDRNLFYGRCTTTKLLGDL